MIDSNSDDDATQNDTVTAKPLRLGRHLLKSIFVGNFQDNLSDNEFILRAHVHHSIDCDCKTSFIGRCVHIAALLLHMIDTAVKSDEVLPSTSKPCTQDKGKKCCKTPQPLHLVDFPFSKRKPP